MSTFADGLYQYGGQPVSSGGLRFSSPWSTVYFVDGIDGNDGNKGTSPDKSFKTIQKAINASTYQDVIYVRPLTYKLGTGFNRYTEDVTVGLGGSGGSGAIATNANKTIIGLTQRVTATDFLGVRWKYASTTNLTVNAPCLHIENIGFLCEDATYAINLQCDGATRTLEGTTGFSIFNCAIKGDGKLYGNGGNEIQIVSCRFQCKYDGTAAGINLVGSTNQVPRPIIRNCEFIGGNANAAATAYITTAAPVYDLMIRDCYFSKIPASGVYLNIAGTSNTGVVANCFFGAADINTACTGLVAGVSGARASALYDEVGIEDFSS